MRKSRVQGQTTGVVDGGTRQAFLERGGVMRTDPPLKAKHPFQTLHAQAVTEGRIGRSDPEGARTLN